MRSSEVTDWIGALRAGRMSLDEVAERFRRRDWPAARRPAPRTHAEMARQQDVEVDVQGSYDEVTAAFDRGDLTSEEYRVLSDAVADAINRKLSRGPEASPGGARDSGWPGRSGSGRAS
jgi:hypothetical protein